ncbi:MAG: M56 family metallopeptidase [Pirellulaceae bacterium]
MNATDLMAMLWSQVWQVTLVALLVALLVRWLARNRPHLAHVLWLLVLLKCLTPPLWSSPGGVFCWLQASTASEPAATNELPPSPPSSDRADGAGEPHDADVVVYAPRRSATTDAMAAWIPRQTEAQSPPRSTDGWTWRTRTLAALLAVWLSGVGVVVAAGAWRWWACWKRLRGAAAVDDRRVKAQLARLSRKLGVRRRVRLLITNSRVGPAVIGVVRPLIVLPLVVVQGKSAAELEPILAHELMHIRRGDLWISLLQTLAQTLWWFHPLVWLASRLISREAERCCDEQVVAELHCEPATYARSLLDVLDLKQTLLAVPTFPGVRPVEVTSKRLERIMQLGQGCRKRTPWWCWMLLVVLAAAALPGAAFQAAAGEGSAGKRDPNKTEEPWTPVGAKQPLVVVYKVDGLLKRIRDEYHVGGDRARQILRGYLPAGPLGVEENFAWQDDGLVVLAAHTRHQEISKILDLLRKTGFRTIRFDTIIATADRKFVDKIIGDWQVLPGDEKDVETALDFNAMTFDDVAPVESIAGKRAAQGLATEITERRTPATMQVLDEQRRAAVMQALQGDARSNTLACPTVTLFDRQKALIADTVQRPFVVGVKRNEDGAIDPNVRIVNEGLIVRLHPQLEGDAKLRLSCGVTFSDIRDVGTTTIPGGGEKSITLQVPEVATIKIDSLVQLENGKTLAIGGLNRRNRNGKEESLLVLIRARVLPLLDDEADDHHDAAAAEDAPPIARSVADATAGNHAYYGKSDWRLAADDRKENADTELSRTLDKKIDVDWSDVALADALLSLAQTAGVNVTIDDEGLHEEGVTKSMKVSLDVKQVSVRSVLRLLLEPLHLTYRIKDETLQVTSKERARGETLAMVYAVADLVVPVAKTVRISKLEPGKRTQDKQPVVEFNSLVELITSTVAPDTWSNVGGSGAISPFETNLSLVVRQTRDVHEEIADLLEQLRRLQDIQVTLQVQTARVSAERFDWISRHPEVMQGEQLADFLSCLESHSDVAVRQGPKITLFNGQGLEWQLDKEFTGEAAPLMLQLQPVASGDRRHVRLSTTVNADNALSALANAESVAVPDGASMVFDLTEELHTQNSAPAGVVHSPQVRDLLAKSMRRRGGQRTLCIITPTIVIQEEEQQAAIPR